MHTSFIPVVISLALIAGMSMPVAGVAANSDCVQPLSTGSDPTASDCAYVLKAAVGTVTCEPFICDANDSGTVTASDALVCLQRAVGQSVTLACPSLDDVTTTTLPTSPPTVSIISPASGTTYTTAQTVTIVATATDDVGIAKVEFYDGATLVGTDTTFPYTYDWSFTSADNGTHNWTAKAFSAAGSPVNLAVSATLQ